MADTEVTVTVQYFADGEYLMQRTVGDSVVVLGRMRNWAVAGDIAEALNAYVENCVKQELPLSEEADD